MAPPKKAKQPIEEITIRRPSSEDVQRAVAEVARHKASLVEYSGLKGQATKQFTERWGMHRKAFGWASTLYGMEEDKRQACIRDFLDLCKLLGFLDQHDMFDDLGSRAEAVAKTGPTEDAIKARTEAELADAPEQVATTVTERLADRDRKRRAEIDGLVGGTVQ